MTKRPEIADCTPTDVRQWYYLKSELVDFARQNGLRTTGGKFELVDRIAYFLEFRASPPRRPRVSARSKFDWHCAQLSLDTPITDNYRNTQNLRRFMRAQVGPHFKFSIPLMDWMKANVGKTLNDAVAQAQKIAADKRAGVKQKDQPHNQLNAYTRAYFAKVKDGNAAELRRLWREKRKRPGPYVFHIDDLKLVR